jgi:hypothetical protein
VPGTLLALLAVLVLAGCGGEAFQPTHTGVVPVGEDASVGQTFRPAASSLRGVDLLVATFGRAADPDGTLRVVLRDGREGPAVAEGAVSGDAIGDNRWVAVRFDAPAVVGEFAAIEVTWDGEEPIALRANVPPPEVGEDRLLNDPVPGGQLLRDGEPAAGDLAFRAVGGSHAASLASAVARLARGVVTGLLDRPLFGGLWLLAMGGSVVLAVWGLRVARASAEP